MDDGFVILLILIGGYILLSPIILFYLFSKQKNTIHRLEKELRNLKHSLQDQLEQLARIRQESGEDKPRPVQKPEPIQKQEPVPVPEPTSARIDAGEPVTVFTPVPEPVSQPARSTAVSSPREPVQEIQSVNISERIRTFLQGFGMWPPASEAGMDRETVLMQWWLPRVGGSLALLAALFFGVYINQDTSPFFKCFELFAVSIGLSGLGWFMERKYKTFGGVLFVTGLIMLYLTSVAAYVLPATQVIRNPLIGSIVQGVILVGICGLGLLRRSTGLVLLTFYFGYFLGLFMVYEGLREGALIEAGLLFIAGMVLVRREQFRQLAWVLVSGSYLVVLAFPVLALVDTLDLPGSMSVQVFNNVVFLGIVVAYFLGLLCERKYSRILLSIGSSLAILSTFCFYRSFYPDDFEWASLVLGIVMLAGAIVGWNRRGCGYLAQLLFIKASFLIGVWAILHFASDLRWMVLALQTVVVAFAARRAKVIAMELLVWAVAAVSLFYYVGALDSGVIEGTFVWWMMVVYPLVVTLAMAFLLKPFDVPVEKINKVRKMWAYSIVPGLAVGLWMVLFEQTPQRSFDMALPFIVLIYLAGALAFVPFISRWIMLELAAFAFLLGCLHYCEEPFSILQLSGIIIAAAVALHFLVRKPVKWAIVIESTTYVLTLVPLTLWMLQVLDNWMGQAIVVFLLCSIIVLIGMAPQVRQVGSWGVVPVLVFMLSEKAAIGAGFLNIIALATGLCWLVIPVLLPQVKRGMGWAVKQNIWALLCTILFWGYAILFGDQEATWMAGQWVFSIIALLLLLGAFLWSMHGYLVGALLFALTVTVQHVLAMTMNMAYVPWKSEALLSSGLLYTFALLLFFLKPSPLPEAKESVRKLIATGSSGASALLFFLVSVMTFQYKELGWMDWYTPILATTAFTMILLGMFFRDSVFRRLGLVALLFPLVRLFLVDIQDALHRIIAFAAAAILLTLLGYLYHRLSSRLTGENEP